MHVTVVGRRAVEFKDKQTGQDVRFVELHLEKTQEGIEGTAVQTVNTTLASARTLPIPSAVELHYDALPSGKAKLVDITLVK